MSASSPTTSFPTFFSGRFSTPLAIIYQIRGSQVVVGALWIPYIKIEKHAFKADNSNLTGIVTDENANPLDGVTVTDRTSGSSVRTGPDGKYSILTKEGNILTFGLSGMADFTLKLGKEQKVDVEMKPDIELFNTNHKK